MVSTGLRGIRPAQTEEEADIPEDFYIVQGHMPTEWAFEAMGSGDQWAPGSMPLPVPLVFVSGAGCSVAPINIQDPQWVTFLRQPKTGGRHREHQDTGLWGVLSTRVPPPGRRTEGGYSGQRPFQFHTSLGYCMQVLSQWPQDEWWDENGTRGGRKWTASPTSLLSPGEQSTQGSHTSEKDQHSNIPLVPGVLQGWVTEMWWQPSCWEKKNTPHPRKQNRNSGVAVSSCLLTASPGGGYKNMCPKLTHQHNGEHLMLYLKRVSIDAKIPGNKTLLF